MRIPQGLHGEVLNPLGSILSTERALLVLQAELGERWPSLTLKPKTLGWLASWKLSTGVRCRMTSTQRTLLPVLVKVLEKDRLFR